jgi:hypothetical protein
MLKLTALILFSGLSFFSIANVERRVESLVLYNFANFVQWPAHAFDNPKSPIQICLFGDIDFADGVHFFQDIPVRGRKLNFLMTQKQQDIANGCHILYVGINKQQYLTELFNNLNHLYVLSVGNSQGFIKQGGILNILRTRDQKQFEIDLLKAKQNGLALSSDLLELARIINTKQAQ